jgi:hypothetical protein
LKPTPVTFLGGAEGDWRVDRIIGIRGAPLPTCPRVARVEGRHVDAAVAAWVLRGVRTHEGYTDESAFDELTANLRASEEWRYVEREVEVRLSREA